MKLPRSLSGADLAKALKKIGYEATRQTGSHLRLSFQKPIQHHITIPNHDPLRVGTLSAILGDVAENLKISKQELLYKLFPET